MKNLFLFAFFVILLSSCSFYNPLDPLSRRIESIDTEEQQIQSFEGVIENTEISISSHATHILLDENGKLLAMLQSSHIALSQYFQKKVQVQGVFETFPDGEKVLNVQQLIPIIEPVKEDVDAKVWKSYKDQNTPFTFKYPPYLTVETLGQSIFLNDAEKNTKIKITRFANQNNRALKEFVTGAYQEVTIGENLALKIVKDAVTLFYMSLSNEVVKIQFIPSKKDEVKETEEADFHTMLQSLMVNTSATKQQTCGGAENILCPQGFRCELIRGNLGKCVDVNNKPIEVDSVSSTQKSEDSHLEKNNPLKDILSLDGAEYENTNLHFTVQYPSSWWYKSFGSNGKSIWRIEFAEKEIENIEDGSIILTVQNGARGTVLESENESITLLVSRDDNSHFEFTGNVEYKEKILSMAKSLVNQ